MYCDNCGKYLNDGARFCDGCGAKIPEIIPTSVNPESNQNGSQNQSQKQPKRQMTFAELKSASWAQIKGSVGTFFLIGLVWGLIFGAISGIAYLIVGDKVTKIADYTFTYNGVTTVYPVVIPVAAYVASILTFVFAGSMEWGMVSNSAKMFRGEKADFKTGFSGLQKFWAAFSVYILKYIYVYLWSILFVIPGLVKTYSYACAMFIKQENPNLGANDCITKSRALMDGHKMRLFLYDLWFAIVMILAMIFTLGIGLIWLIPYYYQTRYNFYQNIKK